MSTPRSWEGLVTPPPPATPLKPGQVLDASAPWNCQKKEKSPAHGDQPPVKAESKTDTAGQSVTSHILMSVNPVIAQDGAVMGGPLGTRSLVAARS